MSEEKSDEGRTGKSCGGHAALAEELRAHATGVLNLLEPWLDQVRDAPASADGTPVTCAACPLCALMALLRGERSEMAVRVAEQASGLLSVLRAALAEGNGPGFGSGSNGHGATNGEAGTNADPATNGRAGSNGVQRIPVSRVDGGTASGPC